MFEIVAALIETTILFDPNSHFQTGPCLFLFRLLLLLLLHWGCRIPVTLKVHFLLHPWEEEPLVQIARADHFVVVVMVALLVFIWVVQGRRIVVESIKAHIWSMMDGRSIYWFVSDRMWSIFLGI